MAEQLTLTIPRGTMPQKAKASSSGFTPDMLKASSSGVLVDKVKHTMKRDASVRQVQDVLESKKKYHIKLSKLHK